MWTFLLKRRTDSPYVPVFPVLGIYPKKPESASAEMPHSCSLSLFIISENSGDAPCVHQQTDGQRDSSCARELCSASKVKEIPSFVKLGMNVAKSAL